MDKGGGGHDKGKSNPNPSGSIHVTIIDKPDTIDQKEVIVKTKKKGPSIKKKKKVQKKKKKDDCKDYYEGIGVVGIDTIDFVYPGYPADVAGLKKGDFILSPENNEVRGPKGTVVTIVLMRDGKVLTFNIIRDRICIDGKKP